MNQGNPTSRLLDKSLKTHSHGNIFLSIAKYAELLAPMYCLTQSNELGMTGHEKGKQS